MHPAGHVLLGMGDDCALLRALPPGQVLAVSSDMLVEGRHFFAGTDPAAIGHKALAVNLSDLAAMGARPLGFTLALALPSVERAWLQAFSHGMLSLASRAGCPLIGGDTTRGPLTISITVMGAVPAGQALRRDGAQAGDQIWVSGPLGAAALAVEQRRAGRRADGAAALRLDWPMPRFDVGLRLLGLASAAMDISDGLAGDLNHLLNASGRRGEQPLGAALYAEALPLDTVLRALPAGRAQQHVLHGGDDYELLFTVPPVHEGRVAALCPTAQKIGQIRPGHGMLIIDTAGRSCPVSARGHDHFAQ
ncbi:MAG: thiamine-phosphate kinase [Lautropia sp.]|nr:thiamine-phosphate kinase [Lautropia sp.]